MQNNLAAHVENLRKRRKISDIARNKIKLIKIGREWQACCPFHHEERPSFTINDAKGFYHCFGCGAHGDVVKFLMEYESISFEQAVNKLLEELKLEEEIANKIQNDIENSLSKFNTAPFLFIGSGISRRYVGLEDWNGLLEKFSNKINTPYNYYKSQANGDLPITASLISKAFSEVWWKDATYERSRNKHQLLCTTKDSPLKIEIASYIAGKAFTDTDEDLLEELSSFKEITVDGIITTNYDKLLETLFPNFTVYIGQINILFNKLQPQGIAEIYKIHGCCSEPETMILTNEDYEDYHQKNPYLVAKLLTLLVEHPIIFMGYSLKDENILSIIKEITKCLDQEGINELQDRFFFVEWTPNAEPSIKKTILNPFKGKTFPITQISLPSFLPLFKALSGYKRKFPAHVLRSLKEHVYELVMKGDPKKKLHVLDISDANDRNIEVVFGVGAINKIHDVGYKSPDRIDLMKDIVFPNTYHYDSLSVLKETIPRLQGKFIPLFKYLKDANLDTLEKRQKVGLDKKILNAVKHTQKDFESNAFHKKKYGSCKNLNELLEQHGIEGVIYGSAFLNKSNIDLNLLHNLLQNNFETFASSISQNQRTAFFKTVCLYDFIKYKH